MLSRRQILAQSALVVPTAAFAQLARNADAPAADATVEWVRTITAQPEHYHGWSTVARAADGTLLVVVSGGRESHVCPFGRVELLRSHDDGNTWTWPEVLLDTAIDDRDAGICITPRGTVLVTTFTSLAYEAPLAKAKDWPADRLARWNAAHTRVSAEQRKALLGTWMLRSTDGGGTWSAPYRVPLNSPHGPVALGDGRLLYAGRTLWDAQVKVGVAHSADDGLSWQWLADIPVRPGDRAEDYHELHAVEARSGKLIAHIRNHNEANRGETLQSESTDGGKTWTVPHSINVWGLPSHLLRLRSGRLVMAYGFRRQPFGNQARWSDDAGKTWSAPVMLSMDGAGVDLGYPSTVELADGALFTVWYERLRESPRAVLRAARWRLRA
jgi:Neuraminidase (sialidase)